MGSPYHVTEAASQLFTKGSVSTKDRALSIIAESLVHPRRTLLNVFIQQAADRELASQVFLASTAIGEASTVSDFLAEWISILRKVRPVLCADLDASLKKQVWHRDGGQCCISKVPVRTKHNECPLFVRILGPSLFQNHDSNQKIWFSFASFDCANDGKKRRFCQMLSAFIGDSHLQNLAALENANIPSPQYERPDQLMLLSSRTYEHFANGRLSLSRGLRPVTGVSARYLVKFNNYIPSTQVEEYYRYRFITLENKATESTSLPNALYLDVHDKFADALAWLEVVRYMEQDRRFQYSSLASMRAWSAVGISFYKSLMELCAGSMSRILNRLWTVVPIPLRAFAYRNLASISTRIYGYTGSDRTHRLPFNSYLRMADRTWAPRHQAEFRTLRLVETYTRIPAPRGIDTFQYDDHSFLLMTGVPGNGVGRMLATLTDEQVEGIAQDLKKFIAELRCIPKRIGPQIQICNAIGGGVLDWRIGESQRSELKFEDADSFNKYLRDGLFLDDDESQKISKAHRMRHEIVFTHADLNLRNILVGKDGKISGIVDWECAGWYPEYWEYTKMHFTVRHTPRWIADVVNQVFLGYRDELHAENVLSSKRPSW